MVLSASIEAAAPGQALLQRARDVATFIQADPAALQQHFAASFLEKVPGEQLSEVFKDYFDQVGTCQLDGPLQAPEAGTAGRFALRCSKGFVVPFDLKISAKPPYLIEGLLLKLPTASERPEQPPLQAAMTALAELPGTTALMTARLEPGGVVPLTQVNAERPMAIASVSKLYVLSALLREIDSQGRKWADVIALPGTAISLPTGELQNWPAGSPVTLHTLAALSISKSDNTANDALISAIGRSSVEAAVAEAGDTSKKLGYPFLTTREFFALKQTPSLAKKYGSATEAGRRDILQSDIPAIVLRADASLSRSAPRAPGVEWFATVSELVRALAILKELTDSGEARHGRALLAINRPEAFDDPRWEYLGYKGGSEPGVAALAFLVRSSSGKWYAVASAWNGAEPEPGVAYYSAVARVLKALE